MKMNYDGTLTMPSNYAVVTNEEMTYVDGGSFMGTAAAVVTLAGGFYKGGQITAERVYYRGYRNYHYQKVKWQFRSWAMVIGGAVGGALFITGFENKFYSMNR